MKSLECCTKLPLYSIGNIGIEIMFTKDIQKKQSEGFL